MWTCLCRAFNQRALLDAFMGYQATQDVDYNHSKNPQRWSVVYQTPRKDQSQQAADTRKAEIFVNACRYTTSGDEHTVAESFRQVSQARQSGFVYDYEQLQKFQGVGQNVMHADMRVAAFLVPQASAYFQVQGKAVALYDYALEYRRIEG